MSRLVTDHLPLLAGAPNGVKKLRELILELAVRGKLVAQDSDDAAVNSDSEDGWPFSLPNAWRWCSLRDLQPDFQNGASSRGDPDGDSIVVLRLADIKAGEIDLANVRNLHLSASAVEKYRLNANDILVIRVNGSADLVGRFISCQEDIDAIYCDHFIRLRLPRHLINARYLQIASNSKTIRSRIQDLFVTTAGQKTVNQGHIGSLPIPLPPSVEQHRIIAKVDELMALCDRLETRQSDAQAAHARLVDELLGSLLQARDAEDFAECWGRVKGSFDVLFTTKQSVDRLKQALVELAVMGKIVEQDPTDEHADELANRLIAVKSLATADARKQKELTAEILPPFDAPNGWAWKKLDDLLQISGGVTLGRKFGDKALVSKPYLRVANVQRGHLDLNQVKEVDIPEDEIDRYVLRAGDLLITEGGDWDKVGRTCIWNDELAECLHQNHIFRARSESDEFFVRWAELYLNSAPARDYFAGSSKQTTNLASINMTQLRSCAFPLPPLAEQRRIVAKVDALMALCNWIKVTLARAQALNERLAGALVEQAVGDPI
jgi:type I restriction enzyme S subunit